MGHGLNRRGIVLAALALAQPALAQEPKFSDLEQAWRECAAFNAVKLKAPGESADTVAEGALGECRKQQADVRAAIAKLVTSAGLDGASERLAVMMAERRQDVKAVAIAAVLQSKRATRP